MGIDQKIALITGASSGIGAAIAQRLCEAGYYSILVARSEKKLKHISGMLMKDGLNCSYISADISNERSVESLFEKASQIGEVSIIVNNAGVGIFSNIAESKIADWDTQINVNLRGAFLICRRFIPPMQSKKSGIIVFINSVAGHFGYPYSAAYVASKFGLRGLADSLRNELRNDKIKVISVHPGSIDTNFWDLVNVDFPRSEMLSPYAVADSVVHAINAPGSAVIENFTIRRVEGDF